MNANQLMAQILDSLDRRLVYNGMAFREEMTWENFARDLSSLLFRYYDDVAGEDPDYEPSGGVTTPSDMSEDDEEEDEEESESRTLSDSH